MEPSGVLLSPRTSSRGRRAFAAAALITIVAACQSPAATTTPTAASTPTGTPPSAALTPAASAASTGLSGLFHVVGSEPVISRSMFPGRGAVLPGAITVAADGRYHAWVIAFGGVGTQEVHDLTSTDAVSWSEVDDPSLAGLAEGFGNPGALPSSVLETEDGWVMYLVGTLLPETRGWDIWRATAPGPEGPWSRSEEPALRRGAAGEWDAAGLDFPTVLPTDEGFVMLFSGIDSTTTISGSVGRATSTDGIAWTKDDGPVIEPGLCGDFDDRAIQMPRVVAVDVGLAMLYAGYTGAIENRARVGFADSTDGGLTWACEWPSNALAVGELPAGDGVHMINAFMRGDRVALLIEWLMDDGTDVWLAHLGPREP